MENIAGEVRDGEHLGVHLLQGIDTLLELDIVGGKLGLRGKGQLYEGGWMRRWDWTLSSAWPSCSRRNWPLRAAKGEKVLEKFFPMFWNLDISMIAVLRGVLKVEVLLREVMSNTVVSRSKKRRRCGEPWQTADSSR